MPPQTLSSKTNNVGAFDEGPQVIETSFDFNMHLQCAIFAASVREDADVDDTEGAETWLDEDLTGLGGPLLPLTPLSSSGESTPSAPPSSIPASLPRVPASLANTPPSTASSSAAPHPGTQPAALTGKQRRQKKHKANQRKRKRAATRAGEDAFDHKPSASLSDRFKDIPIIKCDISARAFSRAQGAWIGLAPRNVEEGQCVGLETLKQETGMRVLPWDGKTTIALADKDENIITVLVGQPANDSGLMPSMQEIADALDQTRAELRFGRYNCLPKPPGGCEENRRGDFKTAAIGVSYGGGQKVPANLKHTRHNQAVLDNFMHNKNVRRALKYGSHALAAHAPKMFAHYRNNFRKLYGCHRHLRRIYKGTIYPAVSLNFGPAAVSIKHKDHNNLADGLCWILALGDYDPKCGGHLILWELGLIVEFPPGSSILLPSAVISHGNVAIRPGETRSSITQYAAGGLFRWVEYGFATWEDFLVKEPARARAAWKSRPTRWRQALRRYSKVKQLYDDRVTAFA